MLYALKSESSGLYHCGIQVHSYSIYSLGMLSAIGLEESDITIVI
jgi:hypothetical protein